MLCYHIITVLSESLTVEYDNVLVYKKEDRTMKKILTIDGGGIKGIFATSFLAQIEEKCNIRICDYFDLIAGTSTGGIIAAAMALGISARDVMRLYIEKGKDIFPNYKKWSLFRGKYDTEPLEKVLSDVFQNKVIKDCKTRLLIPTYNIESGTVRIFKTPHSEDLFYDKKIKIIDCLLATTAAPIYFKPHKMEGGTFIDGGVGANNPSVIGLIEGITRCKWNLSNISLLSIGNIKEVSPTNGNEKMGLMNALKVQKCFMSAESQYAHNISNIMLPKSQYIRIEQQMVKNQVALDEVTEESTNKLKNWGSNQAMKYTDEIKKIFLQDTIEPIQFYNLEG